MKMLKYACALACVVSMNESKAAGIPTTVSTYHNISIYWPSLPRPLSGESCKLEYREKGQTTWKNGLPLWYDSRNTECRGSLVNLKSGTDYDIRISSDGLVETLSAKTWVDQKPIAKTVYLPELSSDTLTISESGTPDGYVLYTPQPGKSAVIDVKKLKDFNVIVNAKYVIIRGLTLKGAKHSGILLGSVSSENSNDVTDIIIERNDISAWGSLATNDPACEIEKNTKTRYGINMQSAVYSRSKLLSRISVQRNKLHHPSTDSNNWKEYNCQSKTSHPTGPQAISFFKSAGNHVIRYNEIYSDDEHQFNDSMGETGNFTDIGFPNKDSDIYSNTISNTWDDAIESEGANKNVRIYGNYIDKTYIGLGVAPIHRGPIYVFKNIVNQSRTSHTANYGQGYVKYRSKSFGGGKLYLFNNTSLKPASGSAVSGFLNEYSQDEKLINVYSRNNAIYNSEPTKKHFVETTYGVNTSFDYDLYNGLLKTVTPSEANGVKGVAIYETGYGLNPLTKKGNFRQTNMSPGFDRGQIIANFNDKFDGPAPDMGAHEANSPDMEFGVDAYIENVPALILNGNFEQSFTSWTNTTYSSIISTGAYEGSKSLQMNGGSSFVAQNVKLTIGSKYRLSAVAKVSVANKAEVVVKFFDSKGNTISRLAVPVTSTGWNPYSLEFTVPAGTTRTTVYAVRASGTQIANFDTFSLIKLP